MHDYEYVHYPCLVDRGSTLSKGKSNITMNYTAIKTHVIKFDKAVNGLGIMVKNIS